MKPGDTKNLMVSLDGKGGVTRSPGHNYTDPPATKRPRNTTRCFSVSLSHVVTPGEHETPGDHDTTIVLGIFLDFLYFQEQNQEFLCNPHEILSCLEPMNLIFVQNLAD